MSITIDVNGTQHEVEGDPSMPLLYALRDQIGLRGAKFGCGLGQCGACTVIVDGRAVYSCLMPISALEGRAVTTTEGLLEDGEPGKVHRAFIEEQAAQCGYCIAGMVMRAQHLLERNPDPTDDQILDGMQTNLCRCGTHAAIIRAVKRAARS
ncbi:(2Fe-2S)-binding protein [Pelagivirga sediminicola]|uniref:(2Fe-2S)-binding protein n=1 Tax=Pelagivirga sediminicola TaxID=2170575 RepID=A0A2T7G965_9RHOB|nr:(2Fe-2S)-binding protein [Pelagivirga sediminicola]